VRHQDITVCGGGKQTSSFRYVDDLVEDLLRVMDVADDMTGTINLGDPQEFRIRELAETIIDLTPGSFTCTLSPTIHGHGAQIDKGIE
jgi:UDP-glucuronate decarboxylase